MKFLQNIISKLKPTKIVKPLGRWRTETCTIKMKNKIDLSNEDQYALVKLKETKIVK
jgi:hypothetical protein